MSKTIESVFAQTIPDWELVVVDDGSKDDTGKIAQRFADADERVRLVRQENGGIASARNKGYAISCASSEYVIFLDHDDVWEADALETLLAALLAAPDAPAAYGISRLIDEHDQPFQPGFLEEWHRDRKEAREGRLVPLPAGARTSFAAQIYENKISTMGQVLIRRSALERFSPPFDPRMAPCDDWDLYLRLTLAGELVFLERVVLSRRIHPNNVSRNQAAMSQKEDMIRAAYLSSRSLSAENRRIVRQAYRAWYREACETRIGWVTGCLRDGKLYDAAKQARHAARFAFRMLLPRATARDVR